jgi:hypothetical protein
MDILNTRFARWTLALLITFHAFLSFFSLLFPLSYRLGLTGITSSLGQLTQGHDYRRFIPLMEAMPVGLLCLSAISGVLYLTAAWLLLRQRTTSFLAFSAALAVSLIRWSIVMRLPAYSQVLSFPASQLGLALLMMVVLWQILQRRSEAADVACDLKERSTA